MGIERKLYLEKKTIPTKELMFDKKKGSFLKATLVMKLPFLVWLCNIL